MKEETQIVVRRGESSFIITKKVEPKNDFKVLFFEKCQFIGGDWSELYEWVIENYPKHFK